MSAYKKIPRYIADIFGLDAALTANENAISSEATTRAAADSAIQTTLSSKANDSDVVHNTGAESIAGAKTLTSAIVVPAATNMNHAVNLGQVQTYVGQQLASKSGIPEAPVQDVTELAAVGAVGRVDKQLRLVEDEGAMFRFDAQSMVSPVANRVILPNDLTVGNAGRWIKTSSDTQDHSQLTGLQGGNSTERYHVTAAEKGRIPSVNVTDALTGTGTPSSSNKFVTADSLTGTAVSGLDPTTATTNSINTIFSHLWAPFSMATIFGKSLLNLANAGALKTVLALDNVNNTADADKPVSTAVQAALDTKLALSNVTAQRIILPINEVTAVSNIQITVNQMTYVRVSIYRRITFTRMSVNVAVLSVGGLVGVSIHNLSGVKLVSADAISTTTVGYKDTTVASTTLEIGDYLFGFTATDTTLRLGGIAMNGIYGQMGVGTNANRYGGVVGPTTAGGVTQSFTPNGSASPIGTPYLALAAGAL